ncbi:YicC family protein [Deltaproteobacteria bacterium]|nr:YicC family protein [Deltaproteobacteria bacterium]
MALSMTGFGNADVQWETWSCLAEIRSVNHRFLDINCRLPPSFQKLEQELKNQIKSSCSRGKIDCTIRLEKESGDDDLRLNPEEAKKIFKLLREFEDLSGRNVSINLADLSGAKIFVGQRSEKPPEECVDVIRECLSNALTDLRNMQELEGYAMLDDIKKRFSSCARILDTIENLSKDEPEQFKKRLEQRIARLNSGKELNPERLEQEVALLADRLDISEEVIRFKTHLKQMDKILSKTELGKKAEFLLQELNREVNTISSKSNQAGISQASVEIKSELEKIREQLQNIQ